MRVTITNQTGRPHDTKVLIDGKPIQRLVAFAVFGDGPDSRPRVVLTVSPDEVEIDVTDPQLQPA